MKLKSLLTMMCVALSAMAMNAKVYMVGQVNGTSWDPTQGLEMPQTSTDVYQVVTSLSGTDGYGWFIFSTGTGDWDSVNNGRYEPATNGTELIPGAEPTAAFKGNTNKAFKVANGDYKVTFDLTNKTAKVEKLEYPEKLYVCGLISAETTNQWNPSYDGVILAKTAKEGEYSGIVTVYAVAGTTESYFTLSSTLGTNKDDWAGFNAGRLSAPSNDAELLGVGETTGNNTYKSGQYSYKVNMTSSKSQQLKVVANMKAKTVSVVDVATGVEAVEGAKYNVIGSEGRIAVAGEYKTVAIYGANGALLSKNNGDYECAKGLYIVVVDGKAKKVVVR